MHRSPYTTIGIFAALLLILIVLQAKLFDALVYFLLAGIIPGTSYALSPLTMFILIIIVLWFAILRISSATIDAYTSYQKAQKAISRSRRLPKRRYRAVID